MYIKNPITKYGIFRPLPLAATVEQRRMGDAITCGLTSTADVPRVTDAHGELNLPLDEIQIPFNADPKLHHRAPV